MLLNAALSLTYEFDEEQITIVFHKLKSTEVKNDVEFFNAEDCSILYYTLIDNNYELTAIYKKNDIESMGYFLENNIGKHYDEIVDNIRLLRSKNRFAYNI